MMPVVRISDATMSKLKPLAIPLEDSIDSLLRRLADAAHNGVPYKLPTLPIPASVPQVLSTTPAMMDVKKPDDLAFTRLLSAQFAGVVLPKANWNTLAKYAHETAFKQLGSFDELRRSTRAHIKQGRYEEDGFVYLPSVDISLQGMDANMSWDNCARLASAIGASVSVSFEWRNNPKAAKRGQKSQLSYP